MILSDSDRETVYYSIVAPCVLSVLGCLFVVVMFSVYESLRALAFKMIVVLSVIDLINAVAFLIPTYDVENSSFSCKVQGILINFSSIAGLVWSTFMAVFLYMAIKHSRTFEESTVIKVAAVIIVASLIDTLMPLFVYGEKAYGKVSGWCWVKEKYVALRYCLFFGPMVVMILINSCAYLKIRVVLSSVAQVDNAANKKIERIRNKLLFYPAIIVICYLPYNIKVLIEETHNISEHSDYILTTVTVTVRCLHGFLNFLIYGLTDAVRKKLKTLLNKRSNSLQSLNYQTIS